MSDVRTCTVTCETCGAHFERLIKATGRKRKRFCSRECARVKENERLRAMMKLPPRAPYLQGWRE